MAVVLRENGGKVEAFTVSQDVGKGKPNRWTDTMLVLYLLHSYGKYSMDMDKEALGMPLFDPKTDFLNIGLVSDAILRFQRHCVKRGIPLKTDGKINCPPTQMEMYRYTIGILNVLYASAFNKFYMTRGYENNEMDAFEFAMDDHTMHPILRTELLMSYTFYGVL